ncbi:MAG: hypothetical protein J5785_01940 [Spirochaetales bacterium]|nr:hypothetical protein [Spirochaetales bacterium]
MLYQNDITPEDNAVAEAKTFSSWEDWHGYATFMLELDENETARAWDEAHAVPKENIDLDTIGLAVMSISDPLAVFDSVDSKGDIRKNQLVVVTEVENDKGEKVVVPLHMQETADRIEVDIIASAYFKGSSGVYDKWASLGALKYLKNNEVGSQLMPLQLRGRENQPLLQKVLQRTDVVNKYSWMPIPPSVEL